MGDRPIGYDALVIATGWQLRTVSGTEHIDGVHGLRTLKDSLCIRWKFVDERRASILAKAAARGA